MIHNWIWWGLGWLFMPKMTIGIIIYQFTGHSTLGLTLAILGGFLDIFSGKVTYYKTR